MNPAAHVGPTGWIRVRSRVIDRLIGVLLGLTVAPVIAVLALLVRRGDGAPSVVGLARVGVDGRRFCMWKLRSMRVSAERGAAGGAMITASNDPRVTDLGAHLRRWRLDELPQLWNVVRGDMSLLGPRPETPSLVEPDRPDWSAVLQVPPGISGPTQLLVEHWEATSLGQCDHEATYRDEILPIKLAIDRWYVGRASPALDAKVLWSMIERFVLGRTATTIEHIVRAECPLAARIPLAASADG